MPIKLLETEGLFLLQQFQSKLGMGLILALGRQRLADL